MRYRTYPIIILFLVFQHGYAEVKCNSVQKVCIESGSTKYFYGLPLTLDCWKYQVTYECKADTDNNCEELRAKNCYQIGASCRATWNNSCVAQEETFKCPTNECKEVEENICLENAFCADGNCAQVTNVKSSKESFGKAASNLAVLAEAAKEFKENNKDQDTVKNPYIFTGKAMECSKNIANFKNCCGISGSGWGEGVFASCDAEEKELAQKRGAGLAVSVGNYCYNKVLGKCTSEHYVYCVFPSKIARIIQEKGRKDQLGISFGNVGGDSSSPNCRGITPEELNQIKFDLIDFSELTDDLMNIQNKANHPETKFKEATAKVSYDQMKGRSVSNTVTSQQQAAGRIKDFYDRTKK